MDARPHLRIESLERRLLLVWNPPIDWEPPHLSGSIRDPQQVAIEALLDRAATPTLGTFVGDAPPDQYRVTIDWGDGSSGVMLDGPETNGRVERGADGRLHVVGNHAYADDGVYYVTATMRGPDHDFHSFEQTVVIAADGVAVAQPDELFAEEMTVGYQRFLTFCFADPDAAPDARYRLTVDWGGGQVSSEEFDGSVVGADGFGAREMRVPYDRTTRRDIVATVERIAPDGSAQSSDSATIPALYQMRDVYVGGSADAVWSVDGFVDGTPAMFDDLGEDLSEFSATIDWGDGTTSAGTITTGANERGHPRALVHGSHHYAAPGQYTVNVDVTHPLRETNGPFQYTVVVGDSPFAPDRWQSSFEYVPAAGAEADESVAHIWQTVSFGDVLDRDPQPAEAYTLTINWGDGTTSTGTVTTREVFDTGQRLQQIELNPGPHAYAQTGLYDVTYTLSRADVKDPAVIHSYDGRLQIRALDAQEWEQHRPITGGGMHVLPVADIDVPAGEQVDPTDTPAEPAGPPPSPFVAQSRSGVFESNARATIASFATDFFSDERLVQELDDAAVEALPG